MYMRILSIARIMFFIFGIVFTLVVGACNKNSSTVTQTTSTPTDTDSITGVHFDESTSEVEHKPYPIEQTFSQPNLYLKALKHKKRMLKYSIGLDTFVSNRRQTLSNTQPKAGMWISIGPGNVGGRTRGLVINPQNPSIMYASAASGGIWKTIDGGTSWQSLTDTMPSLIIGCLAMDPADPETLYAGTGELYTGSVGVGIYKTTNGGKTWAHLSSTFNDNFTYVNAIVVSPNNNQRIYAATGFGGFDGIFRSTDAGSTWVKVFDGRKDGTGGSSGQGCHSLVIRTDKNTDYILANCDSVSSSGIYLNPDAGGSGRWTAVLEESGMGRASLAISPSNQNFMYALAAVSLSDTGGFPNGSLQAVYRSIDGGNTWTARVRAGDPMRLNTQLLSTPCQGTRSQGFYDNVLAVDPVDQDRVWAGGIGMFRSDDGGANWNLANDGIHPDHHIIAFHPQYDGKTNSIMFVGNDGGIFRTDQAQGKTAQCTGRASDIQWNPLNNSYATTQFYYGTVSSDGKVYAGGTQDNGYLLGTDEDGFYRWKHIVGGDGGFVAFDPNNSNIIYLRQNVPLQLLKSKDGGQSFQTILTGSIGSIHSPILIDNSNSSRVWVATWGTSPSVFRSTNGGGTWAEAGDLGPNYGPVNAMAFAPSNPNLMLAAIDHRLRRCDTALTSTHDTVWAETVMPDTYISSIAFDPTNANIAYFTNGRYRSTDTYSIYKSTDAGLTWQGLDGFGDTALPNIPISTILLDPTKLGRMYVGTGIGIFVTSDGGQTWAQEEAGIGNFGTGTLSIAVTDGIPRLYAFTYGRGAWRVRPGSFASKITDSSVVGKKLIVSGENFDTGAVILLNGEELNTLSDSQNPRTTLISKKGGKKIKPGQAVILQVRNGDSTLSNEFQFTRP